MLFLVQFAVIVTEPLLVVVKFLKYRLVLSSAKFPLGTGVDGELLDPYLAVEESTSSPVTDQPKKVHPGRLGSVNWNGVSYVCVLVEVVKPLLKLTVYVIGVQ